MEYFLKKNHCHIFLIYDLNIVSSKNPPNGLVRTIKEQPDPLYPILVDLSSFSRIILKSLLINQLFITLVLKEILNAKTHLTRKLFQWEWDENNAIQFQSTTLHKHLIGNNWQLCLLGSETGQETRWGAGKSKGSIGWFYVFSSHSGINICHY